eukprot:2999802-Prymnesium_polylepis.1
MTWPIRPVPACASAGGSVVGASDAAVAAARAPGCSAGMYSSIAAAQPCHCGLSAAASGIPP